MLNLQTLHSPQKTNLSDRVVAQVFIEPITINKVNEQIKSKNLTCHVKAESDLVSFAGKDYIQGAKVLSDELASNSRNAPAFNLDVKGGHKDAMTELQKCLDMKPPLNIKQVSYSGPDGKVLVMDKAAIEKISKAREIQPSQPSQKAPGL